MIGVAPQPRQMPPPPFDREVLQGIFAEITRSYSYQGFGFTPNGRGAEFGNGQDDYVELRPALLRVVAKMDGPDVLTADLASIKANRILTIAAERLGIDVFLQCAIQIVASVDAPDGDARTFVADQLMHGSQQASILGENYFGGGVRFRNLREPDRPDEDDLSIEPDVNDERLIYLDYKSARTAVTEPIGLDQVSSWIEDAFAFVQGPTMRLLSGQGD
jgi:hypothetical protein